MKNIYLTIVLLALGIGTMAQTSVWDGKRELWTRGNGTEESPYLIESAQNLAFLSYMCACGFDTYDMYFKLTTDIDLNGSEDLPWQPIGDAYYTDYETGCTARVLNYDSHFSGHFDGDGHRIYNIYVDAEYGGLFGFITNKNATIENVKIVNGYIHGKSDTGGIVGNLGSENSESEVCFCNNYGDCFGLYVGGIVGTMSKSSIHDCTNEGNILSSAYAAGILAQNEY